MAQASKDRKAACSGQDFISGLTDGVLQHVLGFLPAVEAVRTCVLGRCWRHVWKSTRRLHITKPGDRRVLNDFVNPLLLLRDRSSTLDEVKFDYDPRIVDHIDVWVRHALLCQAQVLVAHFPGENQAILKGPPLDSQHLRKLQLTGVELGRNFLNFVSCPALEILEIKGCGVYPKRIFSQSVRRLCIEDSTFYSSVRTCISVPCLVWLQLKNIGGKGPLLEYMPSLETAFVKPAEIAVDYCWRGDSAECYGICADCCGDDGHKGRCLLLGGLSNAMNLELIAYPGMFIFRRDLRWCPTFSKLKKLLMNDWCVAIDMRALVCILEHSPVLENLILQLHKELKKTTEMEGNYSMVEKPSAISEHLKIIKVKCEEVDGRVCKILKIISTWDIEITVETRKENSGKTV